MALSRYFTSLAAGTALALALTNCGGDLNAPNEWAELAPEGNAAAATMPPAPRAAAPGILLRESPLERMDCEDRKMNLLCAWADADRDNDPLEILRFETGYTPDAAYTAWERERMEAAIDEIAKDPFIAETHDKWIAPAHYRDENQAREQYALKQKSLQIVSDMIRKNFGLPPIPVFLHKFSEDESHNSGHFDPAGNKIEINYDRRWYTTTSFEKALDVIIHEIKHSIDMDMALSFAADEMKPGDDRISHAAAIWLNERHYIPASRNIDYYKKQYTERVAYEFEDYAPVIDRRAYCNDGRHPLLCLKKTLF